MKKNIILILLKTIVIKDPKNFVLKEGDILFRNNFQQKVVLPSKKFIKLEAGGLFIDTVKMEITSAK